MELEMMRVAAPHIGVEPCAGPKTDVMGFPRVVVECLLALAQHTRGWTAIEIVNLHEVGKAVASEPPRALHADGPADAGLEGLLGLSKVVGTNESSVLLFSEETLRKSSDNSFWVAIVDVLPNHFQLKDLHFYQTNYYIY